MRNVSTMGTGAGVGAPGAASEKPAGPGTLASLLGGRKPRCAGIGGEISGSAEAPVLGTGRVPRPCDVARWSKEHRKRGRTDRP